MPQRNLLAQAFLEAEPGLNPGLRRAALAGILAVACLLRFARLSEQGLLFFDEGHLIMEARSMGLLVSSSLRSVFGEKEARDRARRDLGDAVGGCQILFAKPAHNILLASLIPFFPRADLASLALSAAAGALTVGFTFLLGRALYGPGAGLLAALVLAVSPYHLLYSREGLSDGLTVLCWTSCLLAWLGSGRAAPFLSGAAAGICAATNYRELFLPALFLLLSLSDAAGKKRALGYAAARWACWLAAFMAVIVFFEIPYRAWLAGAGPEASFPNGTYFGQLRQLLGIHGSQGFLFRGWTAFGHYMLRWEGMASLAWLAAALAFQLSRWREGDLLVNACLLLPWLLFSAYWDNASRFFSLLLPLVALVKGRWLAEGLQVAALRLGHRPAAALGAVAFLSCLPPLLGVVPRPAPYLAAANFIAASGSPVHLSTNPRLGEAYLGPNTSIAFPTRDFTEVTRWGARVRWAVVDLQALFGGYVDPEKRYLTAEWAVGNFRTRFQEPYSPLALAQCVLEQDLDFRAARALLTDLERTRPALRVLDLTTPRR